MSRVIVNGKYLVDPQYQGSGFYNYLKDLIQAWAKKSSNQYLILFPEDNRTTLKMAAEQYLCGPSSRVWFHSIPRKNKNFENDLIDREVINGFKADHILFPHLEPFDGFPPIPYSVVIHDIIPTLFLTPNYLLKGKTPLGMITKRGITDYFLVKRHFPTIRHLIAISETTRQSLLTVYGKTIDDKVRVIHPAISEDFQPGKIDLSHRESTLKKFGLKSNEFAVYFGGYTFRKNYHRLVTSFTETILKLRKNLEFGEGSHPFKLVMVGGDGRVKPSQNILPTPKLGEDVLKVLISEAAFSIYPSLFEGFGLPILESLSLGTLPLLSDIPSSREIIPSVPNAPPHLFFNPYRIGSISQSLQYYLSNPYEITRSYDTIKDRAKPYSWKKSGEAFDALLEN